MTLSKAQYILLMVSLPLAVILYYGGSTLYYHLKYIKARRGITKVLKKIKPTITQEEVEEFIEAALEDIEELHK